jgi:hypothetical protein
MPLRGRSREGEGRYRYYVSRRLVTGSANKVRKGWRLSGPETERTVTGAARQLLNDHAAISASACNLGVGAGDIPAVLEAAGEWSRWLQSEALFRYLPGSPRCKGCLNPFGGIDASWCD